MSSSQNHQQALGNLSAPSPFKLPSAVRPLEEAIQEGCAFLRNVFRPEHDNDWIKQNLVIAWHIIYGALDRTEDPIKNRLRNQPEFHAYLKSDGGWPERELTELLRSMANNRVPWSDSFKNEAFLIPELEPTENETDEDLTTILAWDSTFKGDLANVLLETIADYLSEDGTPHLASIINSSGTGKSRMVDQLGKGIISVPMCLRPGSEGFPPPDEILRAWLVSGTDDRTAVQKKLYGFVYSLLVVTLRKLETTVSKKQDIPKLPLDAASTKKLSKEELKDYVSLVVDRHKRLASAFRKYMTTGQSNHATNPDRETFYHEVIELANEFVKNSAHGWYVSRRDGPLQEAGERLCRFIDEHKVLESDSGPQRPLVVLAFDEAHVLTDNPPDQEGWNLFSELRRILQQIHGLPIFSLFISTAGRLNQFSPEIRSGPLAWASEPDHRPLNLISEISFDDIAYPALKDTVTIHRVVEIDWISHLGRPLFGSYWDKLPRRFKNEIGIMDYAMQKLLCGPMQLRDNPAGTLACLSVRFALEFNTGVSARDVSYEQVERHMRLCIAAPSGLEDMITIAGSEPLLAEAAYHIMRDTRRHAVCHLADHSDLNCIDRGRRGELVAALLIMQTYDAARVISDTRWISVANFMEALLPTPNYETLLQSGPTSWPIGDGIRKYDGTFKAIFKDYGMWFNHVIKIERKEMISIDHLWKFVTRGAMILCATNHDGIDIVLPVYRISQNLGPDSVTAIVIQVKNEPELIDPSLFDAMDHVVKSAIFSTLNVDSISDSDFESVATEIPEPEMVHPKPVIRLVFALASPEPAIIFRERPEVKLHSDGFTTFDIWLAGLSCDTFEQIQDEADLQSYETLLERSLVPHDGFKLKGRPTMGKKVRKAKGSSRRRMAPLALPRDSHHGIHLQRVVN